MGKKRQEEGTQANSNEIYALSQTQLVARGRYLPKFSHSEESLIIIPIYQVVKERLERVKPPAQSYTANKLQRKKSNPENSDCKACERDLVSTSQIPLPILLPLPRLIPCLVANQ